MLSFSLTVLQLSFFASIPNNCVTGAVAGEKEVWVRISISLRGSGRRMLKYRGVVRERVAFRPEMVDKETMKLLDHVTSVGSRP